MEARKWVSNLKQVMEAIPEEHRASELVIRIGKKIAKVFDPLGLISPAIIKEKMLLQMLWSRGYDWDDELYI